MAEEDEDRQKRLDEQLALLVTSSNTIKVLTILAEQTASPVEIAPLLELSTSAVSHHVKKLVRLGMVELVEQRDVGGSYQHIYRAMVRPLINNEEWQKLSVAERRLFSVWIFQLLLVDAARSFDAELFDACPSNHLSRTTMVVDQRGFDEVAEIQDRALAEIIRVQELAIERMAGGEEANVLIAAAMMCFELPRESEGLGIEATDRDGSQAIQWREEVKRMKIQEVPSAVPTVAIRKSN